MTIVSPPIALLGGLNLVTPAIRTPPGHAIAGMNYECAQKGYHRCDGYERFDGRPRPSDAKYWVLHFNAHLDDIVEGDTVTGGTSGATGVALLDEVVTGAGSIWDAGASIWDGGATVDDPAGSLWDAEGYLVLVDVAGAFIDGEELQVGGGMVADADGVASERSAPDDSTDATYYQAAIEARRAVIQAVPGAGAVRGVWFYNGATYAFRDDADPATACIMYKATAAGWTAQGLGRSLPFTSGGTYEILEGDTIVGASSAASAVVGRVILESGTWAGGDAAGRLILTGQTGSFAAENLNVGANGNVATVAADSTANALPPGGRYDFVNHNFYGRSDRRRMYGCNGVGPAFEWDGAVFVPIITGMAEDEPTHIAVFKNQLFLSFPGGSNQHSGVGDPYQFTIVSGAGEIAVGDDVTGYVQGYAKILGIFTRNKVFVLSGNDPSDWILDEIADDSGGVEWTVQKIVTPIYLDAKGLRDMRATQAFGDFNMGSVSDMVEPLIRAKRKARIAPVGSLRVRAKNHYRLFYADGTGLSVYFGRKKPEIMSFDLGIAMTSGCSGRDDDDSDDDVGDEFLFMGTADGFVYQLDVGTSFDGGNVAAFLRLPFNNVGSPQQNKRWKKARLEVDATASTQLGMTAEYSYADPDQPPSSEQSFLVSGGGGFWNEMNWDEFYWSSPVEGVAEAYIDGLGVNVSITIISDAVYEEPHVIHGMTLTYAPRGIVR